MNERSAGIRLSSIEDATDDVRAAHIAKALANDVARTFGPRDERPLSIFAYDQSDLLIGGLNGATHWSWLYIRNVWIAPKWRSAGVGRRLLTEAERLARVRHCTGVYLDTFDAGAERFYQRCGFETFGRIADFPPGHVRRFLQKTLA